MKWQVWVDEGEYEVYLGEWVHAWARVIAKTIAFKTGRMVRLIKA